MKNIVIFPFRNINVILLFNPTSDESTALDALQTLADLSFNILAPSSNVESGTFCNYNLHSNFVEI